MASSEQPGAAGEISEEELRRRLAEQEAERRPSSLERELPIGPADEGPPEGPPGTTHRGTGGAARFGTTGEEIDAPVTADKPRVPLGPVEEEAVPEDLERLREWERRHGHQ
jgi:hypothetical protein